MPASRGSARFYPLGATWTAARRGFIATSSAAAGASAHAGRTPSRARVPRTATHELAARTGAGQQRHGGEAGAVRAQLGLPTAKAPTTATGRGRADRASGPIRTQTRTPGLCPHFCGRHHRPEHVVQAELLGQPVHVRLRLMSYRASQPTIARVTRSGYAAPAASPDRAAARGRLPCGQHPTAEQRLLQRLRVGFFDCVPQVDESPGRVGPRGGIQLVTQRAGKSGPRWSQTRVGRSSSSSQW